MNRDVHGISCRKPMIAFTNRRLVIVIVPVWFMRQVLMVVDQAEVQFLEGHNNISTQFRGCVCVINIQRRKGEFVKHVDGEPTWAEIASSAI